MLFLYLWDGDDVGRVLEGGPVVVEVGYGEHDGDGLPPPARHRDARDLGIDSLLYELGIPRPIHRPGT